MASTAKTTNTLRRYGLRSEKNKENLELWLNEVTEEMANNKGGQTVSASANGASFYQVPGMTSEEWMNCLDTALVMIEKGITTTGRSYGQII